MLSFEDEQALALRKAINEIDFPEENGKTLMDRFREVRDDESLNQLHEEWKRFRKKKSLELHPDKNGSDEEYKERFQTFQNNKEKIDQFFDNFTKSSEADSSKRKFIDDSHKASFSSIINFLSNNQSQNPNGQSQSSFQGEGSRASRAQARYSKESNPPRNFGNYSFTSESNFNFNSTKQDPRNQSQTTSQGGKQQQSSRGNGYSSFGAQTGNYFSSRNERSSRDDLSELDKILRELIERISAQNSSSKFSAQSGSNFKKNTNQAYSSKDTYSYKNQGNQNFTNENYRFSTQQDKEYHSQNHDNQSRGESRNFGNLTLVFCFTAQGVGIIFGVQERERINDKENYNYPSKEFVNRFCNNNDDIKSHSR